MADTKAMIKKLEAENAELEQAIAALEPSMTKVMSETTHNVNPGGIRVLQFGVSAKTDEAGVDNGSAWTPAIQGRRTVLGGTFTS